jgi:hypothetical protein
MNVYAQNALLSLARDFESISESLYVLNTTTIVGPIDSAARNQFGRVFF